MVSASVFVTPTVAGHFLVWSWLPNHMLAHLPSIKWTFPLQLAAFGAFRRLRRAVKLG